MKHILIKIFVFVQILTSCCPSRNTVKGVIKDTQGNSIENVEVYWGNDEDRDVLLAMSNAEGLFEFYITVNGSLQGSSILFVKDGFNTIVSSKFSENEAGLSSCNQKITIVRDIVMELSGSSQLSP